MILVVITSMTALLSSLGILLSLMRGLYGAPRLHKIPLAVAAIGIMIMATFILNDQMHHPMFLCGVLVEHLGLIVLAVLQFIVPTHKNKACEKK